MSFRAPSGGSSARRVGPFAQVVPEVFEGSLMLGSHALVLLGVPLAHVVQRVRHARDTRYRLLRGYFRGADDAVGCVCHWRKGTRGSGRDVSQ